MDVMLDMICDGYFTIFQRRSVAVSCVGGYIITSSSIYPESLFTSQNNNPKP